MEQGAWTSERLDDLAHSMRHGFDRNDQEFRNVRSEVQDLRSEMREGFGAVRSEIDGLRRVMLNVGGGIIVALIGVIAAILARGA